MMLDHVADQCRAMGALALDTAEQAAEAEPDVADIIAGALQTSRGHAYELMQAALDARDA